MVLKLHAIQFIPQSNSIIESLAFSRLIHLNAAICDMSRLSIFSSFACACEMINPKISFVAKYPFYETSINQNSCSRQLKQSIEDVIYCDSLVSLFVRLSTCISRKPHGRTSPKFVHAYCECGSVFSWRFYYTLCISGFVDHV